MRATRSGRKCFGSAALAGLLAFSAFASGQEGTRGGADRSTAPFTPDPASIERFGPAYRYPQAGWIVLHIEGEPYERGYQHGSLLAGEIADLIGCVARSHGPAAPSETYKQLRTLVNALFLRKYSPELLEEMKGIADGAAAAGAKFDDRPVDLVDVVVINSEIEIDFLNAGVEAAPNGLEGRRFAKPIYARPAAKPTEHCSAFIANGPATADGKIVFGHITMWSLYESAHFNVWLDVKPSKGHRVAMQGPPGGIMSGMDYYLADSGILLAETTIQQTPFDPRGKPVADRCRRAMQYAENIDDVVRILSSENNGLYTNEWLIGDLKTNEIAMFELGTGKSRLWRSGKKEWIAGTEGFYWGCNNTKSLAVRMETRADLAGRPANLVFRPTDRDQKWIEVYHQRKGKIDADFGFLAFTTPPLAARSSLDAKFTTAALAKQMKTWALFGPPLGRAWTPTFEQRQKHPDIVPLVGNDWALIDSAPPSETKGAAAVDLGPKWKRQRGERPGNTDKAAWNGSLLPAADADIWLAVAFAKYETIASLEKSLYADAKDGKLGEEAKERLALALYAPKSRYLAAVERMGGDVALANVKPTMERSEWFDVAANKGILFLAKLRAEVGGEKFDKTMEDFGREYAGKEVATAQFRAAMEKAAGKKFVSLFDHWLKETGLPEGASEGFWAIDSYDAELQKTLIVVGTTKEAAAQREAGEKLQAAIRNRWSNFTVPITTDDKVVESMLKNNHLLIVGRPETNALAARVAGRSAVKFGPASFELNGKTYANSATAVVAAFANPFNSRYSAVLHAGLSGEATRRCVDAAATDHFTTAEALLLEADATPRGLVLSPSKAAASPVAKRETKQAPK